MLLLPVDVMGLLMNQAPATLPFHIEALPQLLLLGLGLAGMLRVRRADPDPLPAHGAGLAVLVLALLLVASQHHLRVLGPVSWRFLYIVRLGAALAAVPALSWLAARVHGRRASWQGPLLAAAALALCVPIGAPLRSEVPERDAAAMVEVQRLWRWLRDHPVAGRVYIQDTFGVRGSPLRASHALALTLDQSGAEPLGPFYGVVPAPSAPFVASELGQLFGRLPRSDAADLKRLLGSIAAFGVVRVVTYTPAARRLLESRWPITVELGPFTVFDTELAAYAPRAPAVDGRLAFELEHDTTVAHAYHRYWNLVAAPPGARLEAGSGGRLRISGLPPGRHRIELSYAAPPWWLLSIAGWTLIALLWLRTRRAGA
jgi:hypothetical protein